MEPIYIFQREKMTPLRKLLLMKAVAGGVPLNEYTAEGNPLTFSTNVSKPLKSLLIPWTPSQSGNGDPSPENLRPISGFDGVTVWQTGVNILPNNVEYVNDKVINSSGGIDDNSAYKYCADYIEVLPGKTYAVQMTKETEASVWFTVPLYDANKQFIQRETAIGSNTGTGLKTGTFTTTADTRYIRLSAPKFSSKIQVEFGSSASTYAPYTGTSYPVSFPALGDNIFTKTGEINRTYLKEDGTVVSQSDGWVLSDYIPVAPNTKYTFNVDTTPGATAKHGYFTSGKEFISAINSGSGIFTTPSNCAFMRFSYRSSSDIITLKGHTVYGGELDLVSGVLTVEWYGVNANALSWKTTSQSANGVFRGSLPFDQKMGNVMDRIICNKYITTFPETGIASMGDKTVKGYNYEGYGDYIYIRDSSYTTLETFTANIDAMIVYELATVQTYQLTPQQITALIGDNVIWSDTNGSNEVKYLKKG